jgi:Zn-dependent protease
MLLGLFSEPLQLLFFVIALLIAITFHEFAHAASAVFLGDATPKLQGRLSLNPLKHLDPLGTLFLFIAGFGWGKPVPFDPHFIKHGKWGIALVGLSGPLSNFFIAFTLGAFLKLNLVSGVFIDFLLIVIFINILLGVFNLIPLPPLDGSKFLQALVPESKQDIIYKLEKQGPTILFIVIIADNFLNLGILSSIINPIFNFVAGLIL